MDRKDFDRLVSQNRIPSVLLFEGEEAHFMQTALNTLRTLLLPEGMADLNETVLDAPETDQLIAASETLPLMSDRRLVVVRDHPALVGRAEADERLITYLQTVPSSTVLLFFCTKKPDGRKKLYTAVKKLSGIVVFSPLRDRELTDFVISAFRDLGRKCDERTAEYLVFTCGTDASLLLSEIAKVASYSPDSPAVRPDEIAALATPSAECTVFQMVDALVAGQNERAFRLMRSQLLNGTDRVYMLSMLLRQFRLMQHIRIMQYGKCSKETIRSRLGVPPFALDQYMRQAQMYTNGQIKQAVRICFDAEYAVKSGKINQEGSLEAVMMKLIVLRSGSDEPRG